METSNLFTRDSELSFNISERELGALGHFIFPVLKSVARTQGYYIVTPKEESFYDQLYGEHAGEYEAYYTRCGNGAYMGLTQRIDNYDHESLTVSFILSERNYSVEEALEKHLLLYTEKDRDQFGDIEIHIPRNFFFSDQDPQERVLSLSISYCLQKKKQTMRIADIGLFSQRLSRTTRAANISASATDSIEHIIGHDLAQALVVPRRIAEIWE